MEYGRNGWKTILKSDEHTEVGQVNVNRSGVIHVWRRTPQGHWQVTHVEPDGRVRQANGTTQAVALAALET